MTTVQVYTESSDAIVRVVTSQKGAWKYQNAFRHATYAPHQCRDGRFVWQSTGRSDKFADSKTNIRNGLFNFQRGSLHNKPAAHTTDDFGNMVFVA